ncbi:MAG: radical SAM/SPASM domain-containing protein [Bosea sp. (in: a-proteobacteria)]
MTNGSIIPDAELAKYEEASRLPLSHFAVLPTIIIIDVTNSCNLRCPVCPVTIAMTRKRGLMKMEVFQRIIDDFQDEDEKPQIYFNFSGEPTLNPALPDFIAYATQHGHETFLSTNATKLPEAMCERLINAGLSRVNLCMDGFSKEAQESYRVLSDFDEVRDNIERFLNVRERMGAKNPVTVLQTLLTAYSENQIDEITTWARDAGFDKIRFKTFSVGSYTSDEEKEVALRFVPTRDELKRHPTDIGRATCTTPLYQTVVFWNGDLGLCCIDYDQMVQLPNIADVGFKAAYLSQPALEARRKGFLKQFDICKGCSYSNAENLGYKVDLKKGKGLDAEGRLVLA